MSEPIGTGEPGPSDDVEGADLSLDARPFAAPAAGSREPDAGGTAPEAAYTHSGTPCV